MHSLLDAQYIELVRDADNIDGEKNDNNSSYIYCLLTIFFSLILSGMTLFFSYFNAIIIISNIRIGLLIMTITINDNNKAKSYSQ